MTAPRVPDRTDYDPTLQALLCTGDPARRAFTEGATAYRGGPVAFDIETPGLDDPMTIKCVTAAWWTPDGVVSVLLDPARRPDDHKAARLICERADLLALHNAAFDVPGMVAAGLLELADIFKIHDTLVYARMRYTDTLERKNLEALAVKLLGLHEFADGLKAAIRASGFGTIASWYARADIDLPVYRFGALADTAVTLRILDPLRQDTIAYLLGHPYEARGVQSRAEAEALVDREQLVNRIMLRRSAVGLAVDMDKFNAYADSVAAEVEAASATLSALGVTPGRGDQLVAALDASGELPAGWPRTPTGRLSAAKGNLEKLEHPAAEAHRTIAHNAKIMQYLEGVRDRSRLTGRLHPQVGVLGASQTGRMSYNSPPLQQFTGAARQIITDDGQGLTSIDWSQIEPVTLANMAGDEEFLAPFEAGADLYEPIQRAAGVDRDTAKVVLLATMYGQGETKLAHTIGQSVDAARQIKRQMLAAMPKSGPFMSRLMQLADRFGCTVTADGRVLSVPEYNGERAAYRAVNHVVQGTAYSVLSDTLARLHAAGLTEHVQLAMHDELVVDTEAADAVAEVMRTPPEFLVRWSGRVPVFRVDTADLGHHWQSV